MLARSKLNSVEALISKDLSIMKLNFETIINEERNYCELKDSIRMMKSQRNDTEKNHLFEEGKRIVIDKIIKHNEIIYTFLKCKKDTEKINP